MEKKMNIKVALKYFLLTIFAIVTLFPFYWMIASSLKSGFEVINKKGATYYAIALAVIRVIECIIRDEKSILTVSSLINGEYGVEDVALSLPSLVSREGVIKTLELKLNDDEIRAFTESANIIKKIIKEVGF